MALLTRPVDFFAVDSHVGRGVDKQGGCHEEALMPTARVAGHPRAARDQGRALGPADLDEQRGGILQVGDAVNQMDEVTQQNAALAEESAASAANLKARHTTGGGFPCLSSSDVGRSVACDACGPNASVGMNLELQRSKHAASAALKAKSPVRMDTTTKLKALVTDAARPKLKNGFHSEG